MARYSATEGVSAVAQFLREGLKTYQIDLSVSVIRQLALLTAPVNGTSTQLQKTKSTRQLDRGLDTTIEMSGELFLPVYSCSND